MKSVEYVCFLVSLWGKRKNTNLAGKDQPTSTWTSMHKVPLDFPSENKSFLLFWSMSLEDDSRSVKICRVEFLTLKHSILRIFAEGFLEKVSLPKFLITTACESLTLTFFNIMPAISHTATYFSVWRDSEDGERNVLPKR